MQTYRTSDWGGKMLGRYRLVRPLGHGGMGEVWQAEDTELQRQVAAKLLPSALSSETAYLRAFEHEARTAASLEHPHILPVHDFGEEQVENEIIPYLIMPLITGGSLHDRMSAASGLLPLAESLSYLRQAAEAIEYAHAQKVLHRDIKPANMLLQQQWLLLTDFGIAKLLAATAYSQTHAGAGTPEYMAPEQAQGHAEAASDDYSLTIIAYQLFTGQKPFSGTTPLETLIKQMQTLPPSPRQFNPQLPLATELVFFKGLAKRPEARFDSSTVFVEALEESLHPGALQPTSSDPEATILAPWSRRSTAAQPTYRGTPSTPLPIAQPDPAYQLPPQSIPMGERSTLLSAPQAADQADRPVSITSAPTALATPRVPARKIPRRGLLLGSTAAAVALAAGGTGLAYYLHRRPQSLARNSVVPPGPHKLIPGVPVLRLTGHTGSVANVLWHPSGRYLATAGNDTHVLLWDVWASLQKKTGTTQVIAKPLRDWKFSQGIDSNMMSWSDDGHTLAVLGRQGSAISPGLYIINSDQQSAPLAYIDKSIANGLDQPYYFMLSWSPVADLLAVSLGNSSNAELWQSGKTDGPVRSLIGPLTSSNNLAAEVENLAWSNDGTLLAGLRTDGNIVIWDVKTGKVLQPSLSTPTRTSSSGQLLRRNAMAWSPHARAQLLSSDLDSAVVSDALTTRTLFRLGTDDPAAHVTTTASNGIIIGVQVNGLAWSPNGRYIAGSYEHSRQVYIWDTQNKQPKKTSDGLQVQDLLFGVQDGHGVFLPPKKGSVPASVDVTIIDMAWSPDGRYLATASNDSTVIIWQVDGV